MSDSEPKSGAAAPVEAVRTYGGLLLVVVLAAALRFRELGRWWLNPDEGIYFSGVTRETFGAFWAEVAANAHPPLYHLLLRALGYVTWDYVALRGLSALCGVAAVVAVWAAARELVLATPSDPRAAERRSESVPDPDTALRRAGWAGLSAATILAIAPGAVTLSQVMRPYMLQVALLAAALTCLLRYRREPTGRALATYLTLIVLALLTHYSSVLALGALGVVVAFDGVTGGHRRAPWRRLAASHLVPAAVVAALFAGHLRALAGTELAERALNGWLSPYMIDSVSGAVQQIMGYHTTIATDWTRGPLLVMLAAVPFVAIARRRPTAGVLAVAAIGVGVVGAAMHVYPLGATRHTAWLMALTIPTIGWLVPATVTLPGRAGPAAAVALVGLFSLGGPVGGLMGDDWGPWAPSERLLERDDLLGMLGVVDPEAEPAVVVLSEAAFYLLLPFYAREREAAVRSPDGTLYTFGYGSRHVLVSSAWELKADTAKHDDDHLARVIDVADEAFPHLGLGARSRASLLAGGWLPPLLEQIGSPPLPEPVTNSVRYVPGLFAVDLDLDAVRRVFADPGGAADFRLEPLVPSPHAGDPELGPPSARLHAVTARRRSNAG